MQDGRKADDLSKKGQIRAQYLTEFSPREYHSTFYSVLDDEVKFFLEVYHNAFEKDNLLTSRGSNQRRVLDFGCGPVPVYAGTAAYFANSVTMAEIAPSNRQAINSWMNSEEGALDWNLFFSHIASLDGGTKTGEDYAQRLRDVFQLVVPCDGELENPLHPICQTYDVVMSTLCLEFATISLDDYRAMLANVTHLIKPGGVLMMAGALGNTSYCVGQTKYPSVNLTKEAIADVVTSVETLELVALRTLGRQTSLDEKPADHNGIFFVMAQKMGTE
ncbi:indolethylamine N-methyltransferase-like [Macrobrachium rosenbergii]|uniref:indolethylamine N-methyltransferase-like n=1 Tax=Macrobrachium rosenbergii TaxID=79674 RepID=UPI0034D4CDE5